MRKLVVNTFMTLDGVMQAPGGPQEDPTGGFEYGGWAVNYFEDLCGSPHKSAYVDSRVMPIGPRTRRSGRAIVGICSG
jgi:hypothetical protein